VTGRAPGSTRDDVIEAWNSPPGVSQSCQPEALEGNQAVRAPRSWQEIRRDSSPASTGRKNDIGVDSGVTGTAQHMH
jgi:hypothetical protein